MDNRRYLIVNADDFGRSPGVNRGIVQAHERGIVTSASLMVRWPAAAEAAVYGREYPSLSLGLHFDLGEWAYRDRRWVTVYELVPADDAAAVADEAAHQLGAFSRLVGRNPTHIDSHQHVHRREPVRSVLGDIAYELAVPLRHCSPKISHCGGFHGQTGEGSPLPDAISVDGLIKILAALPPGFTELGCHPGVGNDLDTTYRNERAREVETLCDPRVRETILANGVELRSFDDVALRAPDFTL